MRIAIVNDSASEAEILRRAVGAAPQCEVSWTASSVADALSRCASDRPDLVLLDVAMPGTDAARTTRAIMQRVPCPILLVTPAAAASAAVVLDAIGFGALDSAAAPVLDAEGNLRGASDLLRKIATIARLGGRDLGKPVAAETPALLAIGASTGGPKALATILAGLPATLDAAVVIVQHVDAQFAGGLAAWLATQATIPVRVARAGDRPEAGTVLVAATNDHLELVPGLTLRYTADPADCLYRPSVDAFFLSVAKHWPRRGVAALLTGMGRDGARGLLALKQAGWHTIAQDEATSAVYGMPKAAAEIGAAVEVLPLDRIAAAALLRGPAR